MRVAHLTSLIAVASIVGACGGKPKPEQPVPQPEAPVAATPRANQDSTDAARRAAEEARRRADADRAAAERNKGGAAELRTMINFDYDKSDVRQADQATLDRKAAVLAANAAVKIRISGHADERGSDEYNLALGNRRAAAAKRYLESKGIDGSRIEVISYGEERPLKQGTDEDAYAANRRDEFEATAGGDALVAPK